mmetsp:Transcript_40452/g.86843  ORF Transcript_40452/g.86843 Transcript_40452/m.86843 type:complete len:267 (-) Transcript_40452:456-1256(-)
MDTCRQHCSCCGRHELLCTGLRTKSGPIRPLRPAFIIITSPRGFVAKSPRWSAPRDGQPARASTPSAAAADNEQARRGQKAAYTGFPSDPTVRKGDFRIAAPVAADLIATHPLSISLPIAETAVPAATATASPATPAAASTATATTTTTRTSASAHGCIALATAHPLPTTDPLPSHLHHRPSGHVAPLDAWDDCDGPPCQSCSRLAGKLQNAQRQKLPQCPLLQGELRPDFCDLHPPRLQTGLSGSPWLCLCPCALVLREARERPS